MRSSVQALEKRDCAGKLFFFADQLLWLLSVSCIRLEIFRDNFETSW